MLPSVAKTATSCLLHWSGLDRWQDIHPGARRLPTVVGYHRVVANFSYATTRAIPSMLISQRMFEHHLDLLCKQYRLISLDELEEEGDSGKGSGRPTAAITFDDGYRDVYYNAYPILKRKGIPAAVFVVTGLVGTDEIPIHDRVYGLLSQLFSDSPNAAWVLAAALREIGMNPSRIESIRSQSKDPYSATRVTLIGLPQRELLLLIAILEEWIPPFAGLAGEYGAMSWDMLAEMEDAGFTIGSHTCTHPVLTNETNEDVRQQLKTSREQLEAHLKKRVLHLAYPDGRFSSDILQAAEAAGYRFGYTTCQHRDPDYPMLTIPRTVLWQTSWLNFRGNLSEPIMSCQLSGVFDLISGCSQDHQDRRDPETQLAEQQQ